MSLTPERTAELQELCRQYRIDVLTAIHGAQSGHPGGSLSVCEILTLLYQQRMHVDAAHPDDPDRDRLVLCKVANARISQCPVQRKLVSLQILHGIKIHSVLLSIYPTSSIRFWLQKYCNVRYTAPIMAIRRNPQKVRLMSPNERHTPMQEVDRHGVICLEV